MHPARILFRPLRTLLRWIAILIAEKRVVRGIRVVNMPMHDADEPAFEKVVDVIELIHRHDPARGRRVARDVRYVLVTRTATSGGEYWPNPRCVLVNASNVCRQVPEAIAMIVVHEATHARLWRMGVGRFPDVGRLEHTCVEAEITFARRVPGTEPLIEGARRKLATKYWEKPRDAAFETYLTDLGYPRWLRRLLLWKWRGGKRSTHGSS